MTTKHAGIQILLAAAIVIFSISISFGQTRQSFNESRDFSDLSLEQYERQLNAILLTRLPEEKQYIADVVKLVRGNKLPRRMVDTSFKWVLNRRGNSKYPFVYFTVVLQLQAKKLGLVAPEFDFKIYSRRQAR